MNAAGITGVIVGILTGVGGLITALVTRRKATAEAESVTVATMEKVILSVRAEMSRLEDHNENLRSRLVELEHTNQTLVYRVSKLERWILTQGHDPSIINGH